MRRRDEPSPRTEPSILSEGKGTFKCDKACPKYPPQQKEHAAQFL